MPRFLAPMLLSLLALAPPARSAPAAPAGVGQAEGTGLAKRTGKAERTGLAQQAAWAGRVEEALAAWDLAQAQRLVASAPPQVAQALSNQCAIAAAELHAGDAAAAWARLSALAGRAEELAPELRADCAALAPRVQAAAALARGANDLLSPHFYLRGANKDEIVASYAAEVLERAWDALAHHFAWQAMAETTPRVGVEFYPNVAALAGATGLSAKAIETSGTIAVCKEHRLLVLSPLATASGYDWADTVAHELTHFVVGRISRGRAPVWLQEGLAKVYESSWRRPPGAHLAYASARRLREAAHGGTLISLQQMHPSVALLPSQRATALAFAEVSSLIGELRAKVGDGPLAAMLRGLGRGRPFAAAWAPPLQPLAKEEATWRARLMRLPPLPPRYGDSDSDTDGDEAAEQERPLVTLAAPGQESTAPQALGPAALHAARADTEWARLGRLGELMLLREAFAPAAELYRRALAAPHGQRPSNRRRLALALSQLGQVQEAAALLQAAVAAEPGDVGGRWQLAALLLRNQDCRAARPHLDAINRVNPYVPAVHDALAECAEASKDAGTAARERRFAGMARAPRPPA